jgi:hypothetical protein
MKMMNLAKTLSILKKLFFSVAAGADLQAAIVCDIVII